MGKIPFIITGATGSIGSEAARSILQKREQIVLACRNLEKAEILKSELKSEFKNAGIDVIKLDLASFESVCNFVDELKRKEISPAGILNNAGILNREYKITKDGFESTLQTNYLSVVLLNKLLMPIMQEKANIVNTVSVTRKIAKFDKTIFENSESKFSQLGTYSTTKFALLLYTAEASKRYGKFIINATDPGVVNSNMISMNRWFDPLADIFFRPFTKSPKKGAIPAINAIFAEESGNLYRSKIYNPIPKIYVEHNLNNWLWETTEKILSQKVSY